MSTENETWHDGFSGGESSETSRDGNRFDGSYEPRPSFNRENSERPHRPRFNTGGERAERAYSSNSERPRRPRFNPNAENGERPQRGGGYGNSYRPQRPYNANSDKPYRPRYNQNNDENGERPQRPYNNRTYNNNERTYNNSERTYNNYDRTQRPRYNQNNSSYRPRYNQPNNGEEGGNRPQQRNNRPQQPRQRFNPNGGGRPAYGGNTRPNNRRTGDYNPNAKYSKKKQIEYKERYIDPNEPIRLNKFLANAGVCSRREADEFITAGVVSVNGQVVTELGTKIKRGDEVKFHDQTVSIERKIYILLNKPKDTVTTSDDPQERRTVMDLVKGACNERIYPVGRLDRNTTGVLLLTNDGDLASKLTHPKYLKKKIYQVRLDKNLTKADMEKIAEGIQLDDGEIHADAISYVDENKKNEVGIEIHSGRNRIVRRIFESLGYRVIKLDRVFFAGLTKKGLRRGEWRFLTEKEVNLLLMGAFE